ncbi:MAG: nickel pincer cofactor biosynthesis protein LarC [Dehalococcoidia bacterium]|nr:MAG: nickel pincer cofactor biosynthesis protein LarC [Chloroflexota bacterium]|tara:strand:- start:4565 stop:5749 length:1185 start_codon:yes stop_codon:yes gene_type:complete
MTLAYINLIGGLSGDMLISSLLDLGLDEKMLISELKKIEGIEFKLKIKKTKKLDIDATHTSVIIEDKIKWNWEKFYNVVKKSTLSQEIKNRVINCFDILKHAEESAHNEKNPHLHELGTSDTLVDICGFFIAIDLLGITKIYSSSIPVTPGFIKTSHGVHETLAPATKKLVENNNIPLRYINNSSNIETVTPTGLSILVSIAGFDNKNSFSPGKFGLGAGTKDFEKFPNVLSIALESQENLKFKSSKKILLETNIDDMSPEIIGSVIEQAIEDGALDCWTNNYTGKKSRSGIIISLLCEIEDKNKFIRFILKNTSSLGLRSVEIDRFEVDRNFEDFNSTLGKVSVKFKYIDGNIYSYKVEYEDILKISKKFDIAAHIVTKKLDYEINSKYNIFS